MKPTGGRIFCSASTSLSVPNSWSVVKSFSRSSSVDQRLTVMLMTLDRPVPKLAA